MYLIQSIIIYKILQKKGGYKILEIYIFLYYIYIWKIIIKNI